MRKLQWLVSCASRAGVAQCAPWSLTITFYGAKSALVKKLICRGCVSDLTPRPLQCLYQTGTVVCIGTCTRAKRESCFVGLMTMASGSVTRLASVTLADCGAGAASLSQLLLQTPPALHAQGYAVSVIIIILQMQHIRDACVYMMHHLTPH
jgi:hypothetical protein